MHFRLFDRPMLPAGASVALLGLLAVWLTLAGDLSPCEKALYTAGAFCLMVYEIVCLYHARNSADMETARAMQRMESLRQDMQMQFRVTKGYVKAMHELQVVEPTKGLRKQALEEASAIFVLFDKTLELAGGLPSPSSAKLLPLSVLSDPKALIESLYSDEYFSQYMKVSDGAVKLYRADHVEEVTRLRNEFAKRNIIDQELEDKYKDPATLYGIGEIGEALLRLAEKLA